MLVAPDADAFALKLVMEDGGFLYIVMLLTVPELHDEYIDKVLYPALGAIAVG